MDAASWSPGPRSPAAPDRRGVVEDRRRARRRCATRWRGSSPPLPDRSASGLPRLPIDRVFSMRGFGTVVTGTLDERHAAVDEELVLLPSGRRVKVRGVQVHGDAQAIGGRGPSRRGEPAAASTSRTSAAARR